MSDTPPPLPTEAAGDPYESPGSVHVIFGAMCIGGTFAYLLYGITCSQMTWYFRSYVQDPPAFKSYIALIWVLDTLTLVATIGNLYYLLIIRGIGVDHHTFYYCDHWTHNAVLVLTELCCLMVELFFIIRMWRFAEKKRLAFLALVPYVTGGVFVLIYLHGMIKIPCYPEMQVNRVWLLISYGFKFFSDGIITGSMIWLLYHRSRGVRKSGSTIRVIRDLIFWSLSTGLILWISTIVHLLTYMLRPETLISTSIFLTRGLVYTIVMLAVINDRRRCQEVIQRPETISLGLGTWTSGRDPGIARTSRFWMNDFDEGQNS